MGSKRSYYESVSFLKMGLGYLPPQRDVKIKVEALSALQEIHSELRNPTLHAGGLQLSVQGTVASGHYLTWDGGTTATVYDPNWNRTAELPVVSGGFLVPTGDFECHITSEGDRPLPWLELQLMTRDVPMVIADPAI